MAFKEEEDETAFLFSEEKKEPLEELNQKEDTFPHG